MTYDRTDRIRRAAILVASLDEALSEQLLAQLPAGEAARVRAEAEGLEAIDPDEQQDVLAEFRRLSRAHGREGNGVEFSPSTSEAQDSETVVDAAAAGSMSAEAPALNDSEAVAMAELLALEHPQIVAAALTRLGHDQSAAVFAALPTEVQAQALERLAALAPADEDALLEVESQLQLHVRQQRDRQQRAAAGAELVRKILARTPEAQRMALLERLSPPTVEERPRDSTPPVAAHQVAATNDPVPRAVDPVAQQARNLASAVRRVQAAGGLERASLEDRSAELEQLDAASLVVALRTAGETTVLRALAASGDAFLERVAKMLPRRQAKKLRKMLRGLGPTRLAELHQAQHDLIQLARRASTTEAAA
jgi:flagellar motor switch protein FliG